MLTTVIVISFQNCSTFWVLLEDVKTFEMRKWNLRQILSQTLPDPANISNILLFYRPSRSGSLFYEGSLIKECIRVCDASLIVKVVPWGLCGTWRYWAPAACTSIDILWPETDSQGSRLRVFPPTRVLFWRKGVRNLRWCISTQVRDLNCWRASARGEGRELMAGYVQRQWGGWGGWDVTNTTACAQHTFCAFW